MITKPGETEIVSYFHNDHLGTPQVLTNDSQTIVWKAAYTPFGGADILTQTVENNFRFPGQYYDQETGLHYNYFRYYHPTTGRYVTPDPIGLEGGINPFLYVDSFGKPYLFRKLYTNTNSLPEPHLETNLYKYAANNPIIFADPLGLRWYKSPIVWMDAIALASDLLSVFGGGPPAYVMGVIASFSSTALTIDAYKHGKATRLDVVVSIGTTIVGLFPHPFITLSADAAILYYDYRRAESDAPCQKK
jgi:RHS repeat-associated protein